MHQKLVSSLGWSFLAGWLATQHKSWWLISCPCMQVGLCLQTGFTTSDIPILNISNFPCSETKYCRSRVLLLFCAIASWETRTSKSSISPSWISAVVVLQSVMKLIGSMNHNPENIQYYTLSNVILVDEKLTSFHQYLRCGHKSVTIVLSIPGAIQFHIASLDSARLSFEHAIYSEKACD